MEETLSALGVDRGVIAAELQAMEPIVPASTVSRSVLGTMNDFAFQLEWMRESKPHLWLTELSLALAETPVSPLRYEHPAEVAKRLLGAGMFQDEGRMCRMQEPRGVRSEAIVDLAKGPNQGRGVLSPR